jgi:phosphoglycerate dehydrogenase-like enzyme
VSTLVFDFADRRPIFRCPPEVVDRLRRLLPVGWELVVPEGEVDGSGDGGGALSPAAAAALPAAEIYMGMGLPPAALAGADRLRWIHSGTAGVSRSLIRAAAERQVTLTNSAGVHGPPVAETVIGMLLHFARGLDFAVAAQHERSWEKRALEQEPGWIRELDGSTVGVVGYGGIGRGVARRARAFGARVVALRRRDLPGDDGDEIVFGADGLAALLAASDYVVVAAPATPSTIGLLDGEALSRMKPGAVLVNVARGSIIDESALARLLTKGHLRGAALDVFAREPLPPDHPLRSAPGTLLTPHISAYSWRFWQREAHLIEDNVRRYLNGDALLNVVDAGAGY